ncbi:MAG TPA: 4'-phosphopantetheinyl transferase superfamily protein, partial [Planctomycetota bacterium]|nr:4'-phosphopantetheinyl transferase superfamily protein [Planctomycetota bacterium]
LRRPDRSPDWPAGVVGSLSHSKRLAVALVAEHPPWRAVGVDVEPYERTMSTGARGTLFRDDEPWSPTRDAAFREADPDPAAFERHLARAMHAFCAKEATYKAFSHWTGRVFGFQDVRLAEEGEDFAAEAVDPRLRADLAPHLGPSPRWVVRTARAGGHCAAWVLVEGG